jgi:uncharacterized protein
VKPDFAQYGFAHQENLIMACIGGSQGHGAKLGATDDTDWYGLYIPPPTKLLGLDREEHFVFTTGGKAGGNGPLDVDVCLYTLMKWAGLAGQRQSVRVALSVRSPGVHHRHVESIFYST